MSSSDASENDVIELASSLGTPEVPTVEVSRDETPTISNRLYHANFGTGNSGFQAGHITGNVVYHHTLEGHSIFDSLLLREDRFVGPQPALIQESKASHRTARLVSHSCSFKWLFG